MFEGHSEDQGQALCVRETRKRAVSARLSVFGQHMTKFLALFPTLLFFLLSPFSIASAALIPIGFPGTTPSMPWYVQLVPTYDSLTKSVPLYNVFSTFQALNPYLREFDPLKIYREEMAQRQLQNNLQQISDSLYQQNKLLRDAQQRQFVASLRPFIPAIVQVAVTPPPISPKTQEVPRGEVYIAQPDLWVGAMVEYPYIGPGVPLTYTVSIINKGDADATGIRLTPSFDSDAMEFDGFKDGSWYLGTIAKGIIKEFTYKATLKDTSGDSAVVKFIAKGNEPDKNSADNTETVTIKIAPTQPTDDPVRAGSGCDASGCWGSGGGGSM